MRFSRRSAVTSTCTQLAVLLMAMLTGHLAVLNASLPVYRLTLAASGNRMFAVGSQPAFQSAAAVGLCSTLLRYASATEGLRNDTHTDDLTVSPITTCNSYTCKCCLLYTSDAADE